MLTQSTAPRPYSTPDVGQQASLPARLARVNRSVASDTANRSQKMVWGRCPVRGLVRSHLEHWTSCHMGAWGGLSSKNATTQVRGGGPPDFGTSQVDTLRLPHPHASRISRRSGSPTVFSPRCGIPRLSSMSTSTSSSPLLGTHGASGVGGSETNVPRLVLPQTKRIPRDAFMSDPSSTRALRPRAPSCSAQNHIPGFAASIMTPGWLPLVQPPGVPILARQRCHKRYWLGLLPSWRPARSDQ